MLHCGAKVLLYDAGMTVGKRIKAARTRKGMAQPIIAKHFSVSVNAVSRWEQGKDKLDIDRIMPLARLLEVPVEWLLEGKGPPPAAKSEIVEVDIAALDPELQATIRALAGNLRKKRSTT